jgi:exodeoxyribonuclease X
MALNNLNFLVIDTETTGLDHTTDKVVEIAGVNVRNGNISLTYHTLINPGIPIPPDKSAIHGIADWDVQGMPMFDQAWQKFLPFIRSADVLVAHNALFDKGFLPETDKPWLDTKRLAQHLWPDAPNHRNQTLRFWKKLRLNSLAHSADGDAIVTAHLLMLLIQDYLALGHPDTIESLINFAESPMEGG